MNGLAWSFSADAGSIIPAVIKDMKKRGFSKVYSTYEKPQLKI
jgi:hypothetical protein